jgi:hypothetical protein
MPGITGLKPALQRITMVLLKQHEPNTTFTTLTAAQWSNAAKMIAYKDRNAGKILALIAVTLARLGVMFI